MNRLTGFKKVAACTAAVMICISAFSGTGAGMINADNAHAVSKELKENQNDISDKKQDIADLIAKQ